VVDAGELDDGRVIGLFGGEALDGDVHLEEHRAVAVIADHGLQPEERAETRAAGDGRDAVQAGRRIEDHVTGGEFDGFGAVGVLDDEFAAVVFVGIGEEERAGKIRAKAMAGAGDDADGTVDVRAEGLAAGVAVEHRREDVQRQGGGHEQRVAAERAKDRGADLFRDGVFDVELLVVFDACALVAGGGLAVDPLGGLEQGAGFGDLGGREDVGDGEEHGMEKLRAESLEPRARM